MSVLEASVRRLVREEATGAAIQTLEAAISAAPEIFRPDDLRRDILATVAEVSREQLATLASRSIALSRTLDIKRKSSPVDTPAGDVDYVRLADMRESAIKLALQIETDPDRLFPLAAKIARFILNGELDGLPRNADTEGRA